MREAASADARASDGSPVDLYRRLPDLGEAALVHRSIPPHAEILELGCGTGRMTHRLLAYGHAVTAVDSSPAMLAWVRGAETRCAEIEGLDLARRFDCVLLASQLINTGDDRQRRAFVETCARHVAADGTVLIQCYDPSWAADPAPTESSVGGVTIRVLAPRREGPMLHATVEYDADGRTWRHGPFASRILDDAELAAELARGGLAIRRWLDERHAWLAATPTPDQRPPDVGRTSGRRR